MSQKRKLRRAAAPVNVTVDDGPGASPEAARQLLEFAAPELRELGSRPALQRLKDTLLWAECAWENGKKPAAERAEMLRTLEAQVDSDMAEWMSEMMERRRTVFAASKVSIGPLRVEKHGDGFRLHVDRME